MLASQQAEKKKKFLGRERQVRSERGRSGGALLEDLRVTVDVGSDDVDGATAEDDDDEGGRRDMPETEEELDGDKTVPRQGGATALKQRLSEFLHLGKGSAEKVVYFPPSLQFGQLSPFFRTSKRRFAHMMMMMMIAMIIMIVMMVILMIIMTKITKKHANDMTYQQK